MPLEGIARMPSSVNRLYTMRSKLVIVLINTTTAKDLELGEIGRHDAPTFVKFIYNLHQN